MEIRSRPRVDSPSQRPLALETLMSSIATVMQSSFSSQLGALQSNFSRQLSAMSHQQGSLTAEISGVLERLDRVEESRQGSGKGSPCPDYWTTRPVVTACQVVAPGPSGQPQSSMHGYITGK